MYLTTRRLLPGLILPFFQLAAEASSPWSLRLASRPEAASNPDVYPYADLIPNSVAFCYNKLVNDSMCCVDEKYAEGVTKTEIRRPNTTWVCGQNCSDTKSDQRGGDLVWTPPGATCRSARVLWIHGGSWIYGSPSSLGYGQLSSKLAQLGNAIVMALDYPLIGGGGNLSTIMAASMDAVRWLSTHGPRGEHCPGARPALFVGGDSAGGGTAMSLVMQLARKPSSLPNTRLRGAFFYSPWLNLMCNTPDYYFHAFSKIVERHSFAGKERGTAYVGDIMFKGHPSQNADWFTANAMDYVGTNASLATDPIASPYWANASDFVGAPAMYFAVGGQESIMGDSVVAAQKAAAAGVDVHLDIYPGMWHVFPMYSEGCGGDEELAPAVRSLEKTGKFIRDLAASRSGRLPYVRALPLPGRDQQVPSPPFIQLNYDIPATVTMAWDAGELRLSEPRAAASPGATQLLRSVLGSYPLAVGAAFVSGGLTILVAQAQASRIRPRSLQDAREPLLAC